MEKPIYANLFSRKTPAKHESLRIFLAAARINTPILHHSNTPGCLLWQSQLSLTTPKGRGFLCLTKENSRVEMGVGARSVKLVNP
jgi:hypothetical protein